MDDDGYFIVSATWETVGRWVAALFCTRCGSTLITNPEVDVGQLHRDWHERNDAP